MQVAPTTALEFVRVRLLWAIAFIVTSLVITPFSEPTTEAFVLYLGLVFHGFRILKVPAGGRFSSFPFLVLLTASSPLAGPWIASAGLVTIALFQLREDQEARGWLFLSSAGSILLMTLMSRAGMGSMESFLGYGISGILLCVALEHAARGSKAPSILQAMGRRALRPFLGALWWAGLLGLGLTAQAWSVALLAAFLPVFTLIDLAVENLFFRIESEQAQQALTERKLLKEEARQMKRTLDQESQHKDLFARVAAALGSVENERDGAAAIVAAGRQVFSDDLIGFFFSPDRDSRISPSRVVGLAEVDDSTVRQLFALAAAASKKSSSLHQRMAGSDLVGLAASVGDFGSLVVSRGGLSYSEDEFSLFQSLCSQGSSLFRVAGEREREKTHKLALMSQIEILESLSSTGLKMLEEPTREKAITSFFQGLGALMSCSRGLLSFDSLLLEWRGGKVGLLSDPEQARTRLQSERSKILSTEDMSKKGFPSKSGLAVTVGGAQKSSQLSLLICSEQASFQPVHLEVVTTLGSQLVSTLLKLEKIAKLQEALEKLKEKQNQLIQSSKMTALGTMVAGLAHEINNPLAAVGLSIDSAILQLNKKPDYSESKLEIAMESVERIQKIIDNLLLFSRRRDLIGRSPTKDTTPSRILKQVSELTRPTLSRSGVPLNIRAAEIDTTSYDEVVQMLVNLILNAKDAVCARFPEREEKPGIEVEFGAAQAPYSHFFSVQDRGVGIGPEHSKRIFEPFFTTKDVGAGTGIGLSIVHEVIDYLGGTIEVESELGEGTKMKVKLP